MSLATPGPSHHLVVPVYSPWAIGPDMIMGAGGVGASGTWPAANRAIWWPLYLPVPATATAVYVVNGAAVSGNVDAGIYDLAGTRLVSTGSTAQSGTSAIQMLDIADTALTPGTYYVGLACDNTTAAFLRVAPPTAALCRGYGMHQQASAFVLPATATFASVGTSYIPVMGVTFRTVSGSP